MKNDNGKVKDSFGIAVRPHIVMERGVCLLTVMNANKTVDVTFIFKVRRPVLSAILLINEFAYPSDP